MSNFFPPVGGTPQTFLDTNTERIQSVNGYVNILEGIGERQDLFDPASTTTLDYKTSSFISVLRKRNDIQPPLPPGPDICPLPETILDYAYGQYSASYSLINLPFELTSAPLVSVSYIGCKWFDSPGSQLDFKSPYFNTSASIDSQGIPGTNLTLNLYASMSLPFPSSIPYTRCPYEGPFYILVCVKLFKPVMNSLIRQPTLRKDRKITSLLDRLTN